MDDRATKSTYRAERSRGKERLFALFPAGRTALEQATTAAFDKKQPEHPFEVGAPTEGSVSAQAVKVAICRSESARLCTLEKSPGLIAAQSIFARFLNSGKLPRAITSGTNGTRRAV